MGLFGSDQPNESQLREVAQNIDKERSRDRDSSYSIGGSSAYDTADEDFGEELQDSKSDLQKEEVDTQDVPRPGPVSYPESNRDSVPEPDAVISDEQRELDIPEDDNLTLNKSSRDGVKDTSSTENEKRNTEGIDSASNGGDSSSDNASKEDRGLTLGELDWDDEFDKDNPNNWPVWKKWFCTITTALICLCVSLGSSLFVSGVFDLSAKMGASRELCVSGLTFYMIGLAFGPTLGAPISETYGRAVVYLTGFPLSMLFVMGVGLSTNMYQILILRFFSGLLASPALAIAGGTINDIWRMEERGVAMATFCLAPFLGPVLGPIIGGFVAENKGWKWTMWVSLMFCGAILPFVLMVPETYKPIILVRRAKKRGVKLDLPPKKEVLKITFTVTLLRPLEMLVVEPIVLLWSFYISFVFAVLFGFFEAFPIIFTGEYSMTLGVSGLPFIGVGIGLGIGVVFFIWFDRCCMYPLQPDGKRGARDENGNLIPGDPEKLLVVGKIGAVAMPISLFWLGWTGRSDIHWLCPTASGVPFGFGLILIFFINMLYFGTSFPPASVASAIGANNLLRYTLASVFPLFTTQMYERLHIDWATSLFGFISLALLPIPWFFQYYGARLRSKSKFGYAAMYREMQKQEEETQAEQEHDKRERELEDAIAEV